MTNSPYNRDTTTDELLNGVDLSGRRVLITGASAGLGAESARALAAHGASVIVAGRDLAKGARAAGAVRAEAAPNARVELRALDLASLGRLARSVRDRGVRACAVHPGGIRAELSGHMTPETMHSLMQRPPSGQTYNFKSVPQGAAPSVWAAVVADAEDIGGRYCEDCAVAQ